MSSDKQRGGVGAGAEAAAGLHGVKGEPTDAPQGERSDDDAGSTAGDRRGSEPLGREHEHKGSYGGEGGAPRTSSDTREPANPSPS